MTEALEVWKHSLGGQHKLAPDSESIQVDTGSVSPAFTFLLQLPTVLDGNAQGADLQMWGRVLSNVSQAVQEVTLQHCGVGKRMQLA